MTSRNLRNSTERWRRCNWPITRLVFNSRAANNEVVPLRLCLASRPAQILRLQQMLHRGCIGAAGLKRSFNGETQTFLTELPGQFQQFHHLSCSGLLAVTDHQRLPDLIEAVWPQTSPALLLERTRAGQGTWLS